jgi:hypothetical protein
MNAISLTRSSSLKLVNNESKIVLGFPVEGKFFGKLGDHFGIGIGAYGNINSEWSFGGVTVGLHFGRLR